MRHGRFFPAAVLFAAVGISGCGDDVTDPDAFLESAEAEAVMRSARALPMLPDLMAASEAGSSGDQAALVRAGELWNAGLQHDRRSSTRRRLAVGYALPVLMETMEPEDWDEVREGVDRWMVTIDAMLQHLAMPTVEERLDRARRYLQRSDLSAADDRRGAYYLLLAVSELQETTPRYVALGLLRDARAAVAAADSTDPRVLERAVRLKDWAERAVAEEDYLLAIQRAYYAIQLVEAE